MSKGVGCVLMAIAAVIFMAHDAAGLAIAEVERPFDCQSSYNIYVDCYMCGRLANNKRVYVGCCASIELFNEYCKQMLA